MSIAATYGNTRFIGSVTPRQFSLPVFDVPSFGYDRASVVWDMGITEKDAFMASLVKFQPLPGFGLMYLNDWTCDDDKRYPKVTLNYIGTKDGKEKPPKVDVTATQQLLTLTYGGIVGGGGGGSPTTSGRINLINYLAPRTTYTWTQYTNPGVFPKYNTSKYTTDQFIDGIILQYPAYKLFKAQFKNQVLNNNLSDFTVDEMVPDKMWTCTSSIDNRLTAVVHLNALP